MADWYKHGTKRWKEGVVNLTDSERGVYISLIVQTYDDEYLPYDHDETNFRLCGCRDIDAYRKIKRSLIKKKKLHRVRGPNGWRLQCNGVSTTLDYMESTRRTASVSGSMGGRGRKKANKNNIPTKALAIADESARSSRLDKTRLDETRARARGPGGGHAHPLNGKNPLAVTTYLAMARRVLAEHPDATPADAITSAGVPIDLQAAVRAVLTADQETADDG